MPSNKRESFISTALRPIVIPWRYHFWGGFFIVLSAALAIGFQISDRLGFANSELYHDVLQRWGAPIIQAAPTLRYVSSGAVFNELAALPLTKQEIRVNAVMNYRKRGLVYFSGFDFSFNGRFESANPHDRPIDLVFVFPVQVRKNKVLLSNLLFTVNGDNKPVNLDTDDDKFIWTGQLKPGEKVRFDVAFSGRGLNSFQYVMDPQLPVNDFHMAVAIQGGNNYDYPAHVVPANKISRHRGEIHMDWSYPSLQSGVPTGVILPSERSFDHIIATMVKRSWVPYIMLFAALLLVAQYNNLRLRFYESYLIAAGYAFYFVLLAYLAAFLNFYVAFILAGAIIILLLWSYIRQLLHARHNYMTLALLLSVIGLPSVAVILQGYTGLIYTVGILLTLICAMVVTTKSYFQQAVDRLLEKEETA